MEQPFATLLFVILGFGLCNYAFLVEAQSEVVSKPNAIPSPPLILPPPPPPPPPSPPPPPPPSPSPPPPPPPSPPPPPPPSPPPPPPPSLSPLPPSSPPPPPPSRSPPAPPPPASRSPPSPPPPPPPPPNRHRKQRNSTDNSSNAASIPTSNFNPQRAQNDIVSHHDDKKINLGKKIGLLFAGIAGILQICVVGFLTFKRRQLLQLKDRYETCSSS